jgi:hypothetical protein
MVAVGEFQSLMAKVAALEMIVEGLISERFEAELSPRAMGEAMIKSAIETEAEARVEHGDHPLALEITQAISSLIDRAVARAMKRKSPGGRS